MITAQQEADYYYNQAETSKVLGTRDPDYKIVAERFKCIADRWQKKADKEKNETK